MRAFALLSLLFGFSLPACAHEFWLEPETFVAQKAGPIKLSVRVGENFSGAPWKPGAVRVIRFTSAHAGATADLLPLVEKQGVDNLTPAFAGEGTHLVALSTTTKYIELEPAKFSHYLHEDGLEHVFDWREAHGQSDKPGRELYRREAATLIQLGDKPSDIALRETGFDLQILPTQNPHALHAGDALRTQILFRGAPLANALVVRWVRKQQGGVDILKARSDEQGWVAFPLSSGDTMLSVVHMIANEDAKAADWQSIWGNLTFHVR